MRSKLKGLSLFANVGIAETYMSEYVDIRVANELLEKRVDFYREMHPKTIMIQGNITSRTTFDLVMKEAKAEECDFLLATPPCQGMSIAGKMDEKDPRNSLIIKIVEALAKIGPKYFLIENVTGMPDTFIRYKGKNIKIKDFIMQQLDWYYKIEFLTVNTADYGTPQSRKRSIIRGSLRNCAEWGALEKANKLITVKDAIGHLPSLEGGESSFIPYHTAKKHNDRHTLWMQNTPSGKTAFKNPVHFPQKEDGTRIKGFATTYKRIAWDKPAPTITMANGSISSQNNVHPGRPRGNGEYSDARVLTLKEIFILSGLPDDWTPPKWASENLIRQVIGEGVPPRLIEVLVKGLPA